MLKKNDYCEMEIIDIGHKGEGIGKVEDFVIFADNCLPGDYCKIKILKMKKSYGYGKVEEIIRSSEYRTQSLCDVSQKCGGCTLMHMKYEAQLAFKEKKVRDSIERIAGIKEIDILPIESMTELKGYRNKVLVPVREEKGEIKIGFFAKNSHRIVENDKCYIEDEKACEIIGVVKEYMIENQIPAYNEEEGKGLIRHILVKNAFETKEILVSLVVNEKFGFKPKKIELLLDRLCEIEGMASISLNYNSTDTNVAMGEKTLTLWGNDYIKDKLGELSFKISAQSFYQVNPVQALKMYNCALEFSQVKESDVVIDAYCGIGTISLMFAKYAKKVYGIEIVKDAVADAKENALINEIHNAEFMEGLSEDVIFDFWGEGLMADILIIDPPRKGCEGKMLEAIKELLPKKIVYISCNPDTFARDIKILGEYGYKLEKVKPFDMFCFTNHVEVVSVLVR